jgi:hypothetical protein
LHTFFLKSDFFLKSFGFVFSKNKQETKQKKLFVMSYRNSNFQGVNNASQISGVLLKPMISGKDTVKEDGIGVGKGCSKDNTFCPVGQWDFIRTNCGQGGQWHACTQPDKDMCPSTIAPTDHNMGKWQNVVDSSNNNPDHFQTSGKENPRPTGVLSANPISAEFANPTSARSEPNVTQPIRCTYPMNAVKTLSDINVWEANFGTQSESFNNDIMPTFCAQQTTACDINPVTNVKRAKCSTLLATDAAGAKCREWASRLLATEAGTKIVDNTKEEYCKLNPTNDDCQCLARGTDAVYKKLKGDPAFSLMSDVCWWKSCQDKQNYLVTSDLKPTGCVANVCQNVTTINQSTLGDYTQSGKIDCTFDKPSPTPDKPGPGPDKSKKKFPLWILAIIIPAALLLIGGILYALFGKKGGRAPLTPPSPSTTIPQPPIVNAYDDWQGARPPNSPRQWGARPHNSPRLVSSW